MERCEEKARRPLENGSLSKEGKGRREIAQMRVAVIGFGMMGRQIAQVFAQHGHEVSVTDENPIALKSGLEEIVHGPYGVESAVAKDKINREAGAQNLDKNSSAADLNNEGQVGGRVVEGNFQHLAHN